MTEFKNILVVIQNNESAQSLLDKAAALASSKAEQPARIHAVRIVYEGLADLSSKDIDKSAELKECILEAVEEDLRQVILDASSPTMKVNSSVVWNRRLSKGVMHAAERVGADLIIKATEDDGRGLIRTPDDWNILRESKRSVLLTRRNSWRKFPIILVAVDALDEAHAALSMRLLQQASALSQQLAGDLHICSFYPLFEPWSTRLALLQNYQELRKELEQDIAIAINSMVRTIGVSNFKLHRLEGNPEHKIEQLANKIGADIVVIGNRARDGLEAAFMGNTAEKILHNTANDILTIV